MRHHPDRSVVGRIVVGLCLTLACLGQTGCERVGSAETFESAVVVSAIDPELWKLLDAQEDPLVSHRPEGTACHPSGRKVEFSALEVLTGPCPYFSAAQPSLVALRVGDHIKLDLWHSELTAPEPAMAHVALLLGDNVLDERWVAIPAQPNVLSLEGDVASAHAGTPRLGLHLHNHGANAWSFSALKVTPLKR
jgi:hypothetical protein